MSRLPGDQNSQHQLNQNQQIVQSSSQDHSIQTINSSTYDTGSIIINSNPNDGTARTPASSVNTSQNSISFSSLPVASSDLSLVQNLSTNVLSQSKPTSHTDASLPIAKKRLKLDIADSSSSCGSTNAIEDLVALKARILEHKFQRLKGLIEK